MYEYKFVKLEIKFFSGQSKGDYHQVIDSQAQEGWRLVQIFDPSIGPAGTPRYIEIIFERKQRP